MKSRLNLNIKSNTVKMKFPAIMNLMIIIIIIIIIILIIIKRLAVVILAMISTGIDRSICHTASMLAFF